MRPTATARPSSSSAGDPAPGRLGGLYALEQLAQDNRDPVLRQTVVDVICAYLRMPYTPPPDGDRSGHLR
ncbi:hypothetical protein [Nonomuraea fuscirosea]|uniref:hypothetical protein n=1 Tax=Nonomuraea fuscirosea TaxID=1291556 RepID=UPI003447440B